MRDFRDAKVMAQTLREGLKQKSVFLTNSESLELVAKILGFHDWNVLSARIQSGIQSEQQQAICTGFRMPAEPAIPAGLPIPEGTDLPVVFVRDIVLFPIMVVPLFVGREKTKRAVECAMSGDKRILAVTQKHAGDDNPGADDLFGVGVGASILDVMPLPDGTMKLVVRSLKRVRIAQFVEGQMLAAKIAPFPETRRQGADETTLLRTVLERFQAYLNVNFSSEPYSRLPHIREPGVLADQIAPLMPVDIAKRQDLLETGDAIARIEKILTLMKDGRQAA
jgi:uncharacterized protein